MFWRAGLSATLLWSSVGVFAAADAEQPVIVAEVPALGKLTYAVEWRLIRGGTVVIDAGESITKSSGAQATVKLDSSGLVAALFKVDDLYTANFDADLCTQSTLMEAHEGKRVRRTEVTVDRQNARSNYAERDPLKGTVVRSVQLDVPPCVHDILGAVLALRKLGLQPGQTSQVPVTDGRRVAQVKVEAQEREAVVTPAGTFQAIRYEANLMNNVIYSRQGRVFIWLSDDANRIPVQFRLRLAFPVGAVNLQLEKGIAP